jgi:hypothetical protein
LILAASCSAEFDARQEIIKFMEKNKDLEKYLHAPVTVMQTDCGCLSIKDEGIFAFQYELLRPEVSADPNVVIDEQVKLAPQADKLVMVVHGWMDKGERAWPSEMAGAIAERVDPNEWVCGSYDWKGGSVVFTSVQAAEYARDIAGPRLAKAILSLGTDFKHVHLIAHSAGSWTIQSAAQKIAAARPETQFHLTFLDAYVPEKWDQDTLGLVFTDPDRQTNQYWAEHYYTRDITWKLTEHDLKYAHNVDISSIDPLVSEHEFPYRWYMATMTGKYERWDEKKETVYAHAGDIDYGLARALESGDENWTQSRNLKLNNPAVKLEKKSK